MLPQQDKLSKGDVIIPLTSYSNGYCVVKLQEAIVVKRFVTGLMIVKCIQGYIRNGFSKEYEFTVDEKDFRLKIPKTISDYEIY